MKLFYSYGQEVQPVLSGSFSSSIQLEVDRKSSYLGAPKDISNVTPRAVSRDLGGMGIRSTVTHLEQGNYEAKPASLIALNTYFLFDSTSGKSRFAKAEIRIVFKLHGDGGNVKSQAPQSLPIPKVIRFCPVLIQGRPTRVAIHNSVDAKVEASLAPAVASIAGVGLSKGYSLSEKFDKDFQTTIKGKPWSVCDDDIGDEVDNAVIWQVMENASIGGGIPDELNLAVLVQHDGRPLQATVEIKVWTKAGVRLFGWPWPRPNPLTFRPSVSLGKRLGLTTFENLENWHWAQLAPYEGSLNVCFNTMES